MAHFNVRNPLLCKVLAACGLWTGALAEAKTWGTESVYYVKAHYSAEAYGKPVQSVMIHCGVLAQDSPPAPGRIEIDFWADSQDLYLESKGDHFAGQVRLEAHSSAFGPFVKYPVIQYWVSFTDGTQSVSEVLPVTLGQSLTVSRADEFARLRRTWEEAFSRVYDAERTSADVLTFTRIE